MVIALACALTGINAHYSLRDIQGILDARGRERDRHCAGMCFYRGKTHCSLDQIRRILDAREGTGIGIVLACAFTVMTTHYSLGEVRRVLDARSRSKIAKLHHSLCCDQKIVWLDVTMHYAVGAKQKPSDMIYSASLH